MQREASPPIWCSMNLYINDFKMNLYKAIVNTGLSQMYAKDMKDVI